jgi:hypothetical protein
MSSNDSDPKQGIYRVQHNVWFNKGWLIAISDLIFLDGVPTVVLEWGGAPSSQYPMVTQTLDPQRLKEFSTPKTDFLYDGPIEDPRKPN